MFLWSGGFLHSVILRLYSQKRGFLGCKEKRKHMLWNEIEIDITRQVKILKSSFSEVAMMNVKENFSLKAEWIHSCAWRPKTNKWSTLSCLLLFKGLSLQKRDQPWYYHAMYQKCLLKARESAVWLKCSINPDYSLLDFFLWEKPRKQWPQQPLDVPLKSAGSRASYSVHGVSRFFRLGSPCWSQAPAVPWFWNRFHRSTFCRPSAVDGCRCRAQSVFTCMFRSSQCPVPSAQCLVPSAQCPVPTA